VSEKSGTKAGKTAGKARTSKTYVDFDSILKKTKFRHPQTNKYPRADVVLPTGLTLLDAAIGNGLPGGRFTMYHGEDGSLKSSFSYHLAGIALSMGGSVWLDDREDKFSEKYARINGLDPDHPNFYYTQSDNLQQYLDLLQNWLDNSREAGTPQLAIEDSLGAISTKDQQESDKEHPMSVAKTLSDWIRKADLQGLNGTNAYPLWINQQRDYVDFSGPSWGAKPLKICGGRAARYKTSLRFRMSTQALSQKDKDKSVSAPIGKLVRFVTEKSPESPEAYFCLVPYFWHYGFDDGLSCLNYLIGMGYIKKGTAEGTKTKLGIEGDYATKGEWRHRFYEDDGVKRTIRQMTRKAYAADMSYAGGSEMECDDEEE
jgi:RecA/RadA recombinase